MFNTNDAIFDALMDDFNEMEFGPVVIESDPWVALGTDPVASLMDSDEARAELIASHHSR